MSGKVQFNRYNLADYPPVSRLRLQDALAKEAQAASAGDQAREEFYAAEANRIGTGAEMGFTRPVPGPLTAEGSSLDRNNGDQFVVEIDR
jgi:hypothetical protein